MTIYAEQIFIGWANFITPRFSFSFLTISSVSFIICVRYTIVTTLINGKQNWNRKKSKLILHVKTCSHTYETHFLCRKGLKWDLRWYDSIWLFAISVLPSTIYLFCYGNIAEYKFIFPGTFFYLPFSPLSSATRFSCISE